MAKETTTLYMIGGAVLAAAVLYFVFRPRAAYAQPGVPGAPAAPRPALPAPAPGVDSALPPGYHPPYESSGRPVSEFPMYSVARLAEPIPGEDGPIYQLLKMATEKDAHDFTDPYTWRGYGPSWEETGTSYADIQTLDRGASIAEVVDRNGRVLWAPGMTPGLTYRDTEYVR